MNYGTKPKPKPKVEQLTFNKAKNSWLNEWKGKGGYKTAVALIDMIRNDYLKSDSDAWEHWKATPIKEMNPELINFIHEVIKKIEDKEQQLVWIYMLESFISHVNLNLLNGSISPLLMHTQITLMDARMKAQGISFWYDEYEDDYEEE